MDCQRLNQASAQSTDLDFPRKNVPIGDELLEIRKTIVPHTNPKKADHCSVHLELIPRPDVHWSSDAQEVMLWLLPKEGQQEGEPILISHTPSYLAPTEETSQRARSIEGEIKLSQLAEGKLILYYSLCKEEPPVCLFLRNEL